MEDKSKEREKRRDDLVKQSEALPGVPEIMRLYGYWRKLEDASGGVHIQAVRPTVVVVSSSTSNPSSW